MHGSRLLDVGRGKHTRLNDKQKYIPKEGFVKRRPADQATRQHLHLSPLGLSSHLTHTSPPPRHAPENSHVASVHSHWNTFVPQTNAAKRMANSAGPTHPITSIPCCMIKSMLLDPTGVSTLRATRGVGLGGTNQVATGVGVGVSSGGKAPQRT